MNKCCLAILCALGTIVHPCNRQGRKLLLYSRISCSASPGSKFKSSIHGFSTVSLPEREIPARHDRQISRFIYFPTHIEGCVRVHRYQREGRSCSFNIVANKSTH